MRDSLEPRRSALEAVPADGGDEPKVRETPSEVHNATTRVTIAWPFSQIKLQEATAELIELAGVLSDLVEALSSVVPEHQLAPLRDRVAALRARLR